jgi:hypothetical protein
MSQTAAVRDRVPRSRRLWHSHAVSTEATPEARDRLELRFGRVIEGRCPEHDIPLERLRRCGWCPECRLGYLAQTLREDHPPFVAGQHVVTTVYDVSALTTTVYQL